MNFVRADISVFQPRPESNGIDYSEAGLSNFGMDTLSEPRFPKSLFLVQPLFATYELNPVAVNAQESVPVPEGLDLNAWIVSPPADEVVGEVSDAEDTLTVHKVKKGKKGKGREPASGKTKRKKHKDSVDDGRDVLAPSVAETEEEKAERERVRRTTIMLSSLC